MSDCTVSILVIFFSLLVIACFVVLVNNYYQIQWLEQNLRYEKTVYSALQLNHNQVKAYLNKTLVYSNALKNETNILQVKLAYMTWEYRDMVEQNRILYNAVANLTRIYEERKPLFIKIAVNVSREHNYTEDYNCVDFAEEYMQRMDTVGQETEYVVVTMEEGGKHAIVRVDCYVDPTVGKYLEISDYKKWGLK